MNRFAGLRLLVPYLRPHRGRVGLALLSLLVAAGTVLVFGACLRALIDKGFAQGRPDVLNYALASLLVVALVLAIASGARFYLVSWLGERVVGNLFFFSSRRRHTRSLCDWSSDVCSSD